MGGALALGYYTRIDRQTKDLDLFLRKADIERALDLFRRAGYPAELRFPHWLGKVHCGDEYVDLIFSSGNGVAVVDDLWFEHAIGADILGMGVKLSPPEEMIWSKAFVQERERFDGADVLHLFYRFGPTLDWQRLLDRFGPHWRVLLSHIIMFGFVYPGRRCLIPGWVTDRLMSRLAAERDDHSDHVCNGTLAVAGAVRLRPGRPVLRRRAGRAQRTSDPRRNRYLDGGYRRGEVAAGQHR